MHLHRHRPSDHRRAVLTVGLFAAGLLCLGLTSLASEPTGLAEEGNYIGAGKCKNCHKSEAVGDQFGKWEASKHAKAFEALASDAAKAAAKERGIEDPQKADECLKCHTTAFGVAEDRIKKGFKAEEGVQCESCHGPGEAHMKARFAAAASAKEGEKVVVPEGEIVTNVPAETCMGCHNEESPTFDGFCPQNYKMAVRHLNPNKERSEDELKELNAPCECGEGCTHKHGSSGACKKP